MRRTSLLVVVAAVALGLSGCFSPDRQLRAEPVPGEKERDEQILIVDIDGVIENHVDRGAFGGGGGAGADEIVERLRKARRDDAVRGVVLAIDSPGGDVTASDAIRDEVLRLRAAHKPVVAHLGGLAASGGYYVASAADVVVAAPTTITGSIGVIFESPDLHLLGEKIGVSLNVVKSGPYKDIASPARAMSDDERKILQQLIDRTYDRFVRVVVEGRHGRGPIPSDDAGAEKAVRALADGRIYDGDQAVQLGLADRTGQLWDAVAVAKQVAGAKHLGVIRYERDEVVLSLVAGKTDVNVNNGVQLQAGAFGLPSPRLQYRWAPGR